MNHDNSQRKLEVDHILARHDVKMKNLKDTANQIITDFGLFLKEKRLEDLRRSIKKYEKS